MLKLAVMILTVSISTGAIAQTRLVGDLPRKDASKPMEALPGLETEYGVARTSDGVRLRTIITRPAGTKGKLPAIFHTQAVSCGSLELPADRVTVLSGLAQRSGMALVRVERSGTGDSEGPACSALDYDTEVRHYREAFDQVSRHAWINENRIVIYGSSLGSTTAPLVAQGKKVAGVVVQGGGATTYLERMINFDRHYLERSGKYRPEQIHDEMIRRIAFHQLYLLGKKTPEQIAAERPDLAGVWQTIRGGAEAPPHYGRPYAWHWQAADKNFLAAWAKIEAPVMVAYASYDQFETRGAQKIIVDVVNQLRPGTAKLVALNGYDHSVWHYPDEYAAYQEKGGQRAPEALIEPILAWLKEVVPF